MKLLLCLAFLCCTSLSYAQPGVSISPNLSWQHRNVWTLESHEENQGSLLGLNAGLFYRVRLAKNVSVEPALTYTRRGSKFDVVGFIPWSPHPARHMLHYVQLVMPLLYYVPLNKSSGINIGAGPYLAYLMKAYGVNDGFYGEGKRELKVGNKNAYYKPLDMGAQFAVGYQHKHWQCKLSYDLGISNVATPRAFVVKNRSAAISLGYIL